MRMNREFRLASLVVSALLAASQSSTVHSADTIQWQSIGLGGGGNIVAVAISPRDPNILVGASDVGGFYWSGDGGLTWIKANNVHIEPHLQATYGADFRQGFAFSPNEQDVVFAGPRRSTDNGRTWNLLNPAFEQIPGFGAVVDPNNAMHGTNIVYSWNTSAVYRSTDGWQNALPQYSCLSTPGTGQESLPGCAPSDDTNHIRGIVIDPDDSTRLLACAQRGLYKSQNSGTTWTQILNPTGLPHDECAAITLHKDPSTGVRTVFVVLKTQPHYEGPAYMGPGSERPNWVDIDTWEGGLYRCTLPSGPGWQCTGNPAQWQKINGSDGPNLVVNPGFQDGGGDAYHPTANWSSGQTGTYVNLDDGQGPGEIGDRTNPGQCCSIKVDYSIQSNSVALGTSPALSIEGGALYRLSAWFRSDNAKGITASAFPTFYDASGQPVYSPEKPWTNGINAWSDNVGGNLTSYYWRHYETVFRTPETARLALLIFGADPVGIGPGTTWIDDVSLTKADALPEITGYGHTPYFMSYSDVVVDPYDVNTIYVGTQRSTCRDEPELNADACGVWQTIDGGQRWHNVTRNLWHDNTVGNATAPPVCGDNVCGGNWETCNTCPIDCPGPNSVPSVPCCGDGVCATGEDSNTCLVDCPYCARDNPSVSRASCCGDGFCDGTKPDGGFEDPTTCSADCTSGQIPNPRPYSEVSGHYDAGQVFHPAAKTSDVAVWALAIGRDQPVGSPIQGRDTLYLGGADHWRSIDRGKTWTEVSSSYYSGADSPPGTWAENGGTAGVYVYPVLTDKRSGRNWLFYGDEDNHLMASYNGGKSFIMEGWQWSGTGVVGTSATAVIPDSDSSHGTDMDKRIYAAISDGGPQICCLSTTNMGGVVQGDYSPVTGRWGWNAVGTGFPTTNSHIDLVQTNSGGFVASVFGKGVWTLPAGQTAWAKIDLIASNWTNGIPMADTQGRVKPYRLTKDSSSGRLYLGFGDPFDWSSTASPLAGETGVWESTNEGAQWRRISSTCSTPPVCSDCTNPPNCPACLDPCMDKEPVTDVAVIDANTLLVSTWFGMGGQLSADNEGDYTGDGGVYRGTRDVNGNWSWTKVLWQPMATGLATSPASPAIVHALVDQHLCCEAITGQKAGVYRSTNGGQTWTFLANDGLMNLRMGGRLYSDAYDPKRIFATSIGDGLFEGTITCGLPIEGFPDTDGDGIADCTDTDDDGDLDPDVTDCAPLNPAVNHTVAEDISSLASCFDNIDNNCNGVVDLDCARNVVAGSQIVGPGSVTSGSEANLSATSANNTYEELTEGGSPRQLKAIWSLPATSALPGTNCDLLVEGYRKTSGDSYNLSFSQHNGSANCTSSEGGTTTILSVLKQSDDNQAQVADLTLAQGTYCVKAIDSKPSGDSSADIFAIDRIFVFPTPVALADQAATGDVGTITLTFAATQRSDDTRQSLREEQSGGAYRLWHTWRFDKVPAGTGHELHLEGYRSVGTGGKLDDFQFYWSTDPASWSPSNPTTGFTLITGALINSTGDVALDSSSFGTSSLSGTIYIRVIDVQKAQTSTWQNTLNLDHLVIKTLP